MKPRKNPIHHPQQNVENDVVIIILEGPVKDFAQSVY